LHETGVTALETMCSADSYQCYWV